ncbi:hypothetical protein Ahy_A10g048799 [Arachis hypogaea]|uniref:Aminotransferase-like plant mobile domain-containing protein n=1 Tax=Arachis hypogaea TaxID=3818 RepID=A0A445B5X2_ARAHY|nr:hypothetical protein Ahy_A10g048799 [Arachis hypogaea]
MPTATGVVPALEDRQSQTKWTVKLTWFQNMVCRELEQDATEESLSRYTRWYIMQVIGGILFPDASDSRVHIRWLPLPEDLDRCGGLSWGSDVLAWMYHQMCRATEHDQCNLGGCAYYERDRHPELEWTPFADPQLHGLVPSAIVEAEASAAVVCALLCFAIVEWHQGDQYLVVGGVVPDDLPIHHPDTLDLHQPEDSDLPELRLATGGGRAHGAEDVGQTIGDLSGPVPRDYLSLRPPRSHHSEVGTSHQGHTPDSKCQPNLAF